jgi:hypothetical protein
MRDQMIGGGSGSGSSGGAGSGAGSGSGPGIGGSGDGGSGVSWCMTHLLPLAWNAQTTLVRSSIAVTSYHRRMEGQPTGDVQIELRRAVVSIPSSSCDALVEELATRGALNDVRDLFLAAGTAKPVRLTDPQKRELRSVITFWAVGTGGSYDDLPDGIYDLRNALQDDLRVVGLPDDTEHQPSA